MISPLDVVFTFLQLIFGSAAIILITTVIFLRRRHAQYDHLPGPPRDSFFFGNFPTLTQKIKAGSTSHSVFYEWCLKYGSTFVVFIMQKPLVITINAEAIKELLVTGNFEKPKERFEVFSFVFGHRFAGSGLITDCNYSSWAPRRATMNPAFSKNMLEAMMTGFNSTSDDLMEKLAQFADGMESVPLFEHINRTAHDVIGKVAFQLDLNTIHDESNPFLLAINKVGEAVTMQVNNPVAGKIPWLLREYKYEVGKACTTMRSLARETLHKRRQAMDRGEHVPQDILAYLMKTFEDTDPDAVEVAIDDFLTLFLAGQEAAAIATSTALREIGRWGDVLNKVCEELDTVLGQRSEIQHEDLSRMPYLDDVIRETLRLFPPVGTSTRRVDREMEIEGFIIPKNTTVLVSTYISGRHPDLFVDPERFWPDRWRNDVTKSASYTSYPFMLGPRSCIGRTFAKIEVKVIIAKFLQQFTYEVDPDQSFAIDEHFSLLKPKDGARVRLATRK